MCGNIWPLTFNDENVKIISMKGFAKKINKKTVLILIFFMCTFFLVFSAFSDKTIAVGLVCDRGLGMECGKDGNWDPNYPRRDSNPDFNAVKKARNHYFWKNSCALSLGDFDEDTWRCSFDRHFQNGAGENATIAEYEEYAKKLYEKAKQEDWINPDYYNVSGNTAKLRINSIMLCQNNEEFFDPYMKGSLCRDDTMSMDAHTCVQIASGTGEDYIWNRRTEKCYKKSDPCVVAWIGWADNGMSDEEKQSELQKEIDDCHEKNGMGGQGSGGSGSNGNGANSASQRKCVRTAILGENGEVCESDPGDTINDLLKTIVAIASVGVGIVGVVGVAVTGTLYLTAGDDEQKVKKAKRRMLEIVIGMALYASAYAILNWLGAMN